MIEIDLDPDAEITDDPVYDSGFTWRPKIVKKLDYNTLKQAYQFENTHLFIICGVSTAGKDTLLHKALGSVRDVTIVPRATSRSSRPGEVDGVHYFFNITDGLLWSTYAQNFYTVPTKLFSILSEKKKVITSQGIVYAPTLKDICDRLGIAVTILYVLPGEITSSLDTLQNTISDRLSIRNDKDQRLLSAMKELKHVIKYKKYLKDIGVVFVENSPNLLGYSPAALEKITSILSQNVA